MTDGNVIPFPTDRGGPRDVPSYRILSELVAQCGPRRHAAGAPRGDLAPRGRGSEPPQPVLPSLRAAGRMSSVTRSGSTSKAGLLHLGAGSRSRATWRSTESARVHHADVGVFAQSHGERSDEPAFRKNAVADVEKQNSMLYGTVSYNPRTPMVSSRFA